MNFKSVTLHTYTHTGESNSYQYKLYKNVMNGTSDATSWPLLKMKRLSLRKVHTFLRVWSNLLPQNVPLIIV